MSQLLTGTRFPAVISVAAVVTILAGIVLYLRDSNGFDINWIKSGPGILFTIGAIAGIVAGYFGGSISGPASDRMGKLLGEIGSNPPTTEQQATLASLQARMEMASKWGFVAMVVALVGMGVARYVTF